MVDSLFSSSVASFTVGMKIQLANLLRLFRTTKMFRIVVPVVFFIFCYHLSVNGISKIQVSNDDLPTAIIQQVKDFLNLRF